MKSFKGIHSANVPVIIEAFNQAIAAFGSDVVLMQVECNREQLICIFVADRDNGRKVIIALSRLDRTEISGLTFEAGIDY